MSAMIIETNWVTNAVQIVSLIGLIAAFILAWKQYKYQKMESVEKADTQIKQNTEMIRLLKKIAHEDE